ncbi:haloacid dehalogenase type II [Caballeronia sp. LZ034LL]|uniref:haloacid dehalogenase type II n=1 Tax=Caballeronia sp. LZ034LL TaxID=3038567 RepID=UPI0028558A9F|nr:haloacid dehalogenase type II [Caballeronia sp. LZ034LL]MDR5835823.1 haloacid dehalogenase type II [Caballeronia sp. LZ034LL]
MNTSSASSPATHAYSKLDARSIKAIAFDMQGTLLDFYGTIVEAGSKFAVKDAAAEGWSGLLAHWRHAYRVQLDEVINGTTSWRSTDQIYRETLDTALRASSWEDALTPQDRTELSAAWSTLKPWPDTRPGLMQLRDRYTLSTLSNGSMSSLIHIVKQHDLPFDCVLTAELVRSSKPDPKVYALAQRSFGLDANEILMVACHKYDLEAAKAFGFRVAFIPRPLEFGPGGNPDTGDEAWFDAFAPSLTALAELLDR